MVIGELRNWGQTLIIRSCRDDTGRCRVWLRHEADWADLELVWLAEATGIHDRHALYSTQEFKKVRVRYFTDEETTWEQAHCGW